MDILTEHSLHTTEQARAAQRVLGRVGLTMPLLEGQTVLDTSVGQRHLERGIRESPTKATVISLNKDKLHLTPQTTETYGNAVAADTEEGLPLRDESVDLIINVDGPIDGGPGDYLALEQYHEVLRVLKPGGQLRTTAPFLYAGGIGYMLYEDTSKGNMSLSAEQQKKLDHYCANCDPDTLDDDGLPYNNDFWLDIAFSLPREEQQALWQKLATELKHGLYLQGKDVVIYLVDRNPQDTIYAPYMIMKKVIYDDEKQK